MDFSLYKISRIENGGRRAAHRVQLKDLTGVGRLRPRLLRESGLIPANSRDAGLTVSEISKLLGHSSATVTARYLDHLTDGRAIAALEAVASPA